ncbi:Retrovirus-related Pol polyprotein from transposon RE1 [Linum perenne]
MSLMGELSYFLGLQIKQYDNGIFIHQAKYCKNMLDKFKLGNLKSSPTPMSISCKLDSDPAGTEIDIKQYRGMIGSLLYLTASRPDISFSVGLCAMFQCSPKNSHLIAVKRIFRYLTGTIVTPVLNQPGLPEIYLRSNATQAQVYPKARNNKERKKLLIKIHNRTEASNIKIQHKIQHKTKNQNQSNMKSKPSSKVYKSSQPK